MVGVARRLLRAVFADYEFFRIYCLELDRVREPEPPAGIRCGRIIDGKELEETADCRAQLMELGKEAAAFGAWAESQLVSSLWCWWGESYKSRPVWPLEAGEAKVVMVKTDAAYRGRGIAPALLGYSAARMREAGFQRLYARIWHSNRASIGAFHKAGWRYMAFVMRVAFRKGRYLRLIVRSRPRVSLAVERQPA